VSQDDIITAYVERLGNADVDGLVDLFTDDCSLQMPLYDEPLIGKERLREFYADLTSRWESIELTVHAAFADDEVGMFEFSFDLVLAGGATHRDSSVDVFRYEGGRIKSLRAYTDSHPLRRALGIA
jgi:ketosteroid isomerase-like protein